MKFISTNEKKRLRLFFAGYYLSSLVLLALLLTVFLASRSPEHKWTGQKSQHISDDELLLKATDNLQARLRDLQLLDEKYISLLKDSGVKANFDTLAATIKKAESSLEKTIDSVDRITLYGSRRTKLDQMSNSCKLVLEGHRSVDALQHALVMSSRQLSNDQKTIRALSSSRDSVIAAYRIQHGGNPPNLDMSFPDADFRLLQSENKFLKSELDLMQQQYNTLYNLQTPVGQENKAAKTRINQSGKAAVSPNLNHGSGNTKEIKYDGVPKE